MTTLDKLADQLHRTVKVALDSGEADSVDDAVRIFAAYRLQVVLGPDVADDAGLQAAALTAVNCAARTLLGGVTVVGAQGPLRVTLPPFTDLAGALEGLGAGLAASLDPEMPTLVVGGARVEGLEPLALRALVTGWTGGVVPAWQPIVSRSAPGIAPAGVLAGAVAVSEVFQRLRGNVMACRRAVGLDLWCLERDWRSGEPGPSLSRLPSSAWLVGLGNLGQAFLWTFGLLPYDRETADLVLQDFDVLAPSNLSTSLLTTAGRLGRRKTRAMAAWAEERGFRTVIVERNFAADFRVGGREPPVAFIGVDNASARQSIEDVGFARIIEAGLGRGAQDFLGINLHTFPASTAARAIWADTDPSDVQITQPAYRAMLEQSGDRCGTVRLAGRSIGAPFVGAVAGALAVAELLRLVTGAHRYELVSCHLRDLASRPALRGEPWAAYNPGSIRMAA